MLATNFEENSIAKINQVLEFVLKNKHSDFYRKKYASSDILSIKSYEDFQKIPFLTKDEFLSRNVEDRTFFPLQDVTTYSFSSGTTGHPIPTIMPHVEADYANKKVGTLNEDLFKELGVAKIFILLQPTADLFRRAFSLPNPAVMMLPGDIHNLKISASIIKSLSIDGILTTPTILDLLIEQLNTLNFNFSSVRWISIGSEFCSILRFEYFKSQFPKAFFHVRYGNSEIGGTQHYRCQYLTESGAPNVFHIKPDSGLIEIIDDNDQILPFDQTGEMVYTDLKNKAFPFLRYKMRDIASLSELNCPCGNNVVLTLDGRANFDVLKIHGATIHAGLIAKAVGKIQDIVEPNFQMHVYEESAGEKIKLKLVLHLKLRPSQLKSAESEFLISIVREKISANLQLSSKMTLADFSNKGIFLPLEIKFVAAWPEVGAKTKNIISHVN